MAPQRIVRFVIGSCLVVLVPNAAWPQSATTGAIAGVVKDTSGAVMPGVTVEAASPALIEKVRVAVTDDQGNYKITELRPGAYTVTFTLSGFSTFKREGIELTSGFTAAANAEMRVGSLQETVTVTAESPLVDVQNVRDEKVLSREVLDTLPTFKSMGGFMAVTLSSASPGTQDVGGNKGESVATMSIHGSRTGDLRWKLDGMNWTTVLGTGSTRTHRWNTAGVQEVVVEAGGTPENETGGAQLNYIPRDGGNRFSVYSFSNYTNSHLQGNNLTAALRARGLTSAPGVDRIWDYGIGLGGPILKDKLWFYQSNRWWGGSEIQPGQYYNQTVGSMVYTPDLSRPLISSNWAEDYGGRVTWQVAANQKINFSDNVQRNCNCVSVGGTSTSIITSPEASTNSDNFWNQVAQATWNAAASSRLLFVAGMSYAHFPQNSHLVFGTTPQMIGVQDLATGYQYNARSTLTGVTDYGENRRRDTMNEQFSTSYVTGSHAFKTGVQLMQGLDNENSYIPNDLTYQLRSGAPSSIIEWASPLVDNTRVRSYALYAQDQWTKKKVTLNYGLRFDTFRGYVLPLNLPPTQFVTALQCSGPTNPPCTQVQVPTGRFLGARNYPAVDNVPNFKDLSPRLGVAYDLFGDGKTAVKMSLNRYVAGLGVGTPQSVAPALAIVLSTTRTWRDDNANFVPDCDLQNRAVNGECGAIANSAFGTPVVNTTYSSDTMTGLRNRANEWQTSAGIQHELRPAVAVNVTYYRTWFGNFTVTDNTAVTSANYDQYCITTPDDPRLPGGGGQLCGLYDVQRVSFGKVSNLITKASKFGKQTDHYNSVDVNINARFGHGGFLAGGVSVSRETTDNCYLNSDPTVSPQLAPGASVGVTLPRTQAFCHVSPPWSAGTQIKLNGDYPLPWWGLDAGAVFQNLPGIADAANYSAPNAIIFPSLGRNLAACPTATGTCTATATIGLIPLMTKFEDRLTQVDLRFSKSVRVGRGRVKGMFDIYNLFNASPVLTVNNTYGSAAWLRPLTVLGPRLFKFGAEIDF